MATRIITKYSSTPGAEPTAGDLSVGELAVNVTSRRLYTKDASGNVQEVGASSGASLYRDTFTGNGSTVNFTMAHSIINEELVDIFIDGVYQSKDNYTVAGAVVTFSTAPPLNSDIEMMSLQTTSISETKANYVEYTPAGTGAALTTVQAKLRESVSVKDFGAVGDGVTDDTAAIQAALDIAGTFPGTSVYFPSGNYRIDTPIVWNKTINLYGESKGGAGGVSNTRITAGAAMNAMISGPTNIGDSGLTTRSCFDGINLNGNSLANYGYQGVTDHTTFSNFRVSGTLLAAMQIGYGWCNLFENLELSYNTGDGLDLSTLGVQNNAVLISSCKIFLNDGVGIKVAGSLGVKIESCTIEANKICGILSANSMQGFSIDACYFEGNSTVGFTFTSPTSVLVKADIIINGAGTATTIAKATPSTVTVTSCFTAPTGSGSDTFIFAPGAASLAVTGCWDDDGIKLVEYYGNNAVSASTAYGFPENLQINGNKGFSQNINITPMGNGNLNAANASRSVEFLGASNRNIALLDLNQWAVIIGGSGGGTWTRSSVEFDQNPKAPVWDITTAGASSTDIFGFTLDASEFPAFHNKFFVFGAWTKHNFSNDGNIVAWVKATAVEDYYSNNNNWVFKGGIFQFPTTGTLQFGFRNLASVAGVGQVTAPVLAELGSNLDLLSAESSNFTNFSGTAVPTTGTWKRGDVVLNTTPSAGGTPGWVCVTAGTPGTWKAMANLAA